MTATQDESAPTAMRPVTDPLLDAPDGAKVTFPDGFVYERVGGTWEPITSKCTGVTAAWCPIHGDCSCPEGDDGLPTLDAETCPLHDPLGPHGVWYDDPSDPLNHPETACAERPAEPEDNGSTDRNE